MKFHKKFIVSFFLLLFAGSLHAQDEKKIPYGNNAEVGKYVEVNGIKVYYEEYGSGEPLLIIHGNGGSVASSVPQIEYFKSKYRVIVPDSRGHGKTELNTDSLTYRQIANDLDALVNHLQLDSINLIGKSDGAIISLLMGINNKSKIKKIVAFAGNIRPDTTAVHPWAPASIQKRYDGIKKAMPNGNYPDFVNLNMQRYGLMLFQPNISYEELQKITAAVLVISADRDVIKNEHSAEIFAHIPRAQLCIMPGSTHFSPYRDPELFLYLSDRFLSKPFKMPSTN